MAAAKTERLLNLTICLLSTSRFVSKREIRESLEAYRGTSDDAFDRMFERDKDELRALGVPIETEAAPLENSVAYRIPQGAFELPPVEFTADEAAVLGVAARSWREASLAATTFSAVAKLRAAGVDIDTQRLPSLQPAMTASEPAFEACWDAVVEQVAIEFDYADRGRRRLEPWGIGAQRGRWYVVGRDIDKDDTRVFRLSRMKDQPRRISRPGRSYVVPAGVDIDALIRAYDPPQADLEATVAVRTNRAARLRRRSTAIEQDASAGFSAYRVSYGSTEALVSELASYGADVLVLEPVELRQAVIARVAVWLDQSEVEEFEQP